MAAYEVDIGAQVRSSDGKIVGTVDRLILRGETTRVGGFLLTRHSRNPDKIVPARVVESSDRRAVVLKITANEVEELDTYIQEQLVRASGPLTVGVGGGGLVDISGSGENWFIRGTSGGQLPNTGAAPFIFDMPLGNVDVQNVSSLGAEMVMISKGTDVVGSNGEKVGKVDELLIDETGQITKFIVRAGWFFKRDVYIPIELVARTTSDAIYLNVTSQEAEARG